MVSGMRTPVDGLKPQLNKEPWTYVQLRLRSTADPKPQPSVYAGPRSPFLSPERSQDRGPRTFIPTTVAPPQNVRVQVTP